MRFLLLPILATLAAAPALAQYLPAPGVGDTIVNVLIGGQSNAVATNNRPATETPDLTPAQASEFQWQTSNNAAHGTGFVRTVGLADPLCNWRGPGYASKYTSLAPAFALTLHGATGRRIILGAFAKGGTGMYCAPSVRTGNYWRPGFALSNNLIWEGKGLEAATGKPVRVIVYVQGEAEMVSLGTQAAAYIDFPHGLPVDTTVDAAGNLVSYPSGFPNPGNLQSVYGNYKVLFDGFLAAFPQACLVWVETGVAGGTSAVNQARVRWVQRQLARDYQAAGKPVVLVRGAEFLPTVDGTHLTSAALNTTGANCAAAAATFLVAPGPPPGPAGPPPTPVQYDLNRAMRATQPHKPRHVGQPMMKRPAVPLVPHQRPPGR